MFARAASGAGSAIGGRVALVATICAITLLVSAELAQAFVQQWPKLVPTGVSASPQAGRSVALSADGNTAIVGAPHDVGGFGSAVVFTRTGSTWTQQALLGAGSLEETGAGEFGESVALSADGNTALVGAPENKTRIGAVWVYTRSGSTWTQQGPKLTGPGEVGEGEFGIGVALSANGDTALISAPEDNGAIGAAWAFTRSGGAWAVQGAKLTSESGEVGTGEFGWSVALSADGNTALLGGTGDNTNKGAAWVFTRSGSTWSQQGEKLTGTGEAGTKTELGYSAALSADGNAALLGGPQDNSGKGAAWAFARSGATWSQVGEKLLPLDEVGSASRFGWSVALSSDASSAVIGGPFDATPAGAAWHFVSTPMGWQQHSKILPSEATSGHLGDSVALSSDGGTALLGAPEDGPTGAAFAFVEPPPGAITAAATGVGASSATLNGAFELGAAHVGYFQYGASAAYGSTTPTLAFAQSFPCCAPPAPGTVIPAAAAIAGLAPATTYHYRLVAESSGGTSFGADHTLTTAAPPAVICHARCCGLMKCPVQVLVPTIRNARQSHKRWREANRAATFARRHGAPVGTTFSFALNMRAKVTLVFTQRVPGRAVRGRCVAQTPHNRHRHRCTRTVTRGTLAFTGHPGTNKVSFTGLLRPGRRLALGSYTLLISARSGVARSNTASLSFTIVR